MPKFSAVPVDELLADDVVPIYKREDAFYDFRNPHVVSADDFSEGNFFWYF